MGDYIKAGEIKVTCNIPINQVMGLSIRECIGAHACAEVTAGIEPGSLNIAREQFNSQPILICASKGGDELLLFSGVISKVRMEKESAYDILHLTAYSLTWLMDLERKSRSFQNCGETIIGVMQKLSDENSFNMLSSAADQGISRPFIQYRETDWEFLLRLSTHLKAPVMAASDFGGRGVRLGFQENSEPIELDVSRERWRLDADRRKTGSWASKEAAYYEVSTGQVLHLGQRVIHRHETLWLYEGEMSLRQGVLRCAYHLAVKGHYSVPVAYNPHLKGVSLTGLVLARNDETVKVHLDIDGEQEEGGAYPYPWMPEHGNMVYCMPEAGSRIRLLVPGEDEQDAIGTHCVRQNGQVCEGTRNPDNRWFETDGRKKLALCPSVIELSSDSEGSRVALQDGLGGIIHSGKELSIQAQGKLTLQGARVELKAPTEITAVKKRVGNPTVVNICHNLDSMGEYSQFKKLGGLATDVPSGTSDSFKGRPAKAEKLGAERLEEERARMQFQLKELLEEDNKRSDYEFGSLIVNIVSAIPQSIERDRLSQIAMGFRPIAGRMGDE